ncbi:MAG: hypothetical protein Q9191_001219 [Dirinaria sp. TL-2023a]
MPAPVTVSPPTIIGIVLLSVAVLILGTALAYRIIVDFRTRRNEDEESLSRRSDLYSPRWSLTTSLASNSSSGRAVAQAPSASGPANSNNNAPSQQAPMSERDRREIPAVLRPGEGPASSNNNGPSQQVPMSESDRREIPAVLRPGEGPPATQSPYQPEDRAQALSRGERGLHRTRPDSQILSPQIWVDIPLEPRLSIPRA